MPLLGRNNQAVQDEVDNSKNPSNGFELCLKPPHIVILKMLSGVSVKC